MSIRERFKRQFHRVRYTIRYTNAKIHLKHHNKKVSNFDTDKKNNMGSEDTNNFGNFNDKCPNITNQSLRISKSCGITEVFEHDNLRRVESLEYYKKLELHNCDCMCHKTARENIFHSLSCISYCSSSNKEYEDYLTGLLHTLDSK